MESNIKDYPHDYWIIAFIVECSANFFGLFICFYFIIKSFDSNEINDENFNENLNKNNKELKNIPLNQNNCYINKSNKKNSLNNNIFQGKNQFEKNNLKEKENINKKKSILNKSNILYHKYEDEELDNIEKNINNKKDNSDDEYSENEEEEEEINEEENENDESKEKLDNNINKNNLFVNDNSIEKNIRKNNDILLSLKSSVIDKTSNLENNNEKFTIKKVLFAIFLFITLMIYAYVNVDNYYSLRSNFLNTQYILYNKTYLINSYYVSIDFKNSDVEINTNVENYGFIRPHEDKIKLSKCSKFSQKELNIIDFIYKFSRLRYALLILNNFQDLIYLLLLFLSIYPNEIQENIKTNSHSTSLLIYFLSNYTSNAVLGYSFFQLDEMNSCLVKYDDYLEFYFYVFIIYGMYLTIFLILNFIYLLVNDIYKLIFLFIFIIFPCSPICSLFFEQWKNFFIKRVKIYQGRLKLDIVCYKERISSVILWSIIIIGIICCFFSFLNFAILKYIQIVDSSRTSLISYMSIFGLFISFSTKVYSIFY